MRWKLSDVPVKFKAAIGWFRKRVPLLKPQWQELDESAKQKAFTVAGVAQLDLVAEVHRAIDAAVADGADFTAFKAAVAERLTHEWGREDSNRLDTIFRTNVQMAYSAGRYQQMSDPDVLTARPFWMFDAVLDNRTTALCRGLNGTVLPADSPFWKHHIPPLHFKCRSGIRSLTRRQAEEKGITETAPEDHADEGFGLAPELADWHPQASDYPPELWQVYQTKENAR